jgi:hypothetical protein
VKVRRKTSEKDPKIAKLLFENTIVEVEVGEIRNIAVRIICFGDPTLDLSKYRLNIKDSERQKKNERNRPKIRKVIVRNHLCRGRNR